MKNSKSWKKGQSGNLKGAPKKENSITNLLKEKLDKDKFVEKLIELANSGDIRAIQMIYDRSDGKVTDIIKHEGSEDSPIKYIIEVRKLDTDSKS